MEFGGTKKTGVVVSPADGETGVSRLWMGGEIPDPLRIHPGAEPPTGYPIILHCFQGSAKGISNVKATLTSAGKPIPFYLNTPANDSELPSGVLIIPKAGLKPNTKYSVSVTGFDAAGAPIDRSWSFTTGAS
jgi:hypothetical protein